MQYFLYSVLVVSVVVLVGLVAFIIYYVVNYYIPEKIDRMYKG